MQLFTTLCSAADRRMADFDAQNVVNTAWAFAKVATAGWPELQLFLTLATEVEWHMADLNAQELANTAWAFTTAG